MDFSQELRASGTSATPISVASWNVEHFGRTSTGNATRGPSCKTHEASQQDLDLHMASQFVDITVFAAFLLAQNSRMKAVLIEQTLLQLERDYEEARRAEEASLAVLQASLEDAFQGLTALLRGRGVAREHTGLELSVLAAVTCGTRADLCAPQVSGGVLATIPVGYRLPIGAGLMLPGPYTWCYCCR